MLHKDKDKQLSNRVSELTIEHNQRELKETVSQEKFAQLRPWGDGLDPNHRPHMDFTFF